MNRIKKCVLAAAVAAAVVALPATAGASGTYKTWTGSVYDFTQAYVWNGNYVVPTVTATTHFETTLTNPPYGYYCKTPDMGAGDGTSTCWYATNDELWGGQTVEIACWAYRSDVSDGERVVKIAWGLKGQTKPSRLAYYLSLGEHATGNQEMSTGYC